VAPIVPILPALVAEDLVVDGAVALVCEGMVDSRRSIGDD
jgi:hypothetical protein